MRGKFSEKNNKVLDTVFFLLLWGIYTGLMFLLFHRQTVNYAGGYESDMKSYVLYIQGVNTGNPYAYPVMFSLAKVFALVLDPAWAVAFAVTCLNALTPLGLKIYMGRILHRKGIYGKDLLLSLAVFAILFVSMLFWPYGEAVYRYKGVFSPNPFHNATYLSARGFSVFAFFSFLEILESLKGKAPDRSAKIRYVIFAVSLLLATMTKPSFSLGFVLAAGVYMLVHWLRRGICCLKDYVRLILAVLPACLDLLYQYRGVFTGSDAEGTELGIGFGFLEAWKTSADNVAVSLILGLAFPLTVLLCNLKELKKKEAYRFAWVNLLAQLFLFVCLYEKGWRMWHMNFAWGYMYGMFYCFVSCFLLLTEKTLKKEQRGSLAALQWAVLLLHLICGMIYFTEIMNGGSYV